MVAREERARDDVRVSDESRSWRRRRRACCRCRSRNRSRSRSRSRISRQYAYRQLPHTKHIDKRTHTDTYRGTQTLHTHTYKHTMGNTLSQCAWKKHFFISLTFFFCWSLFHSFPSFTCAHCGCTDTIYTRCYMFFICIFAIYIYYISATKTSSQLELGHFCCKFLLLILALKPLPISARKSLVTKLCQC